MEIERKIITVAELIDGYTEGDAVTAYDGKLNIRPIFQRELAYKTGNARTLSSWQKKSLPKIQQGNFFYSSLDKVALGGGIIEGQNYFHVKINWRRSYEKIFYGDDVGGRNDFCHGSE